MGLKPAALFVYGGHPAARGPEISNFEDPDRLCAGPHRCPGTGLWHTVVLTHAPMHVASTGTQRQPPSWTYGGTRPFAHGTACSYPMCGINAWTLSQRDPRCGHRGTA